jgi:hypothetical protein
MAYASEQLAAAVQTPRQWVAAALRSESLVETANLSARELIDAAEQEGLLPLLDWQLRRWADYRELPEILRDELTARARTSAAGSMFASHEVRRVSQALAAAGIQTLLLKGHAFALWLYPQPNLRVCGDIDLLVESREVAERAAAVLSDLGYELAFSPGSMFYEMSSRLTVDGRLRSEVDLHSRLVNVPVYADRLEFRELWADSIALPGLDASVRGLSPNHALVHACMHRAVDMFQHGPEKLKWLYDIHLLLARMDQDGWARLQELCREKGLSGVCLRSFDEAAWWFGRTISEGNRAALLQSANVEGLDYRRIHDWRYIQWQNFRALPDTRTRLRWLRERMLPTTSHLRELYGNASLVSLLVRRMDRMLARLRNRA